MTRRPWALVIATAALIGAAGLGGLAYAGDGHDNIGTPGADGGDATCVANYVLQPNEPVCNVVGEDGADGADGETDD